MNGSRHLALTGFARFFTNTAIAALLLATAAGTPVEAARHSHSSHEKSAHRGHKAKAEAKHKSHSRKSEAHAKKRARGDDDGDSPRSRKRAAHERRLAERNRKHEARAHKMTAHEKRLAAREKKLAEKRAARHNHLSAHEKKLAEHNRRLALREKRMAEMRSEHRSHGRHSAQHVSAAHERRLAEHYRRLAILQERRDKRMAIRAARAAAHSAKVANQNEAIQSGNVVRAATAFEGSRYRFGGTSRSGFDCSGFTRYILGNTAGVSIPRTAVDQYYHGTPIDRDAMQPGDLVFFRNTYRRGISHVGIYVGDGRFVHAANTRKGVVVSHLDEPYYANRFAGARRVTERSREDDESQPDSPMPDDPDSQQSDNN